MLSLLFILASLRLVAGHGYLGSITIDGTTYMGNTPGSSSVSSPIRMINDNGPVKGAANVDLACGLNAQIAQSVADAQPGSTVSFKWVSDIGGNWIHEIGPLLTYMASCGPSGCTSFNHSNASWLKIEEYGLRTDGTWAMQDLYQGQEATITLPPNLPPGQYLLRHELIALHNAQSIGGAEFYPACAQLNVQPGGNNTGNNAPSATATVSFPGAYSDTDPGIHIDAYDISGPYTFPGPAIDPNMAGGTVPLAGDVPAEPASSSTGWTGPTSTSDSSAYLPAAVSSSTTTPAASTPTSVSTGWTGPPSTSDPAYLPASVSSSTTAPAASTPTSVSTSPSVSTSVVTSTSVSTSVVTSTSMITSTSDVVSTSTVYSTMTSTYTTFVAATTANIYDTLPLFPRRMGHLMLGRDIR